MYVVHPNNHVRSVALSLRDMLSRFLSENDIPCYAIADEIMASRATLEKFIKGEADLKFMQAVRLMKVLGVPESDYVSVYCKDKDDVENESFDKLERLSYIVKNFDIPALKRLGIITSRAKIDDYEKCICDFLGLQSIYQYEDTSLMPVLFSKSKRKIIEEKESKMTSFWLKCSIATFMKMNNPYDFDRDLLIQLLKRTAEFTEDEKNGYYRFVLVLYQLGVTVLTQSYHVGTNTHGCTMIINGKPCLVVTDMGKKYHKLWLSLLHELYHVINDFDLIETLNYHFSTPDEPDLLFNEKKADQFGLDVLIPPAIQEKLKSIVPFPIKVKALSSQLHVSPAVVYGVYLENLPNGKEKSRQFSIYNKENMLLSSEVATKDILFDPVNKRSLEKAIEGMKTVFDKKAI